MPKNQFFQTPQHPPTGKIFNYGLKASFWPTETEKIADTGRIRHIFVSKMPKTAKKSPFFAIFGHILAFLAIFEKIDWPALTPLWARQGSRRNFP